MSTGHGGKRLGAGRPPRSINAKTRDIADRAIAEGITPLEVMLDNMRFYHSEAIRLIATLIAGDLPDTPSAGGRRGRPGRPAARQRNRGDRRGAQTAPGGWQGSGKGSALCPPAHGLRQQQAIDRRRDNPAGRAVEGIPATRRPQWRPATRWSS